MDWMQHHTMVKKTVVDTSIRWLKELFICDGKINCINSCPEFKWNIQHRFRTKSMLLRPENLKRNAFCLIFAFDEL